MRQIIVLISILGLGNLNVEAASIWSKAQDGKKLELFTSQARVWRQHDLVRVLISESTSASHEDESDMKKDSSFASQISSWFKWDFGMSKPIQATTLPSIGFSSSKSFSADGSVGKGGTFQGQITAEVLDVLPNGNLMLVATKSIRIGRDLQSIKFTGIITPADIDVNNQVLSSQVASATIEFGGAGPVSDVQKEGLIARLLNKVWVF